MSKKSFKHSAILFGLIAFVLIVMKTIFGKNNKSDKK